MANTSDKVISIALAEVGYLEKASNSNLDSKTGNAGSANYTKYGRDMHAIYPSTMDFPAAWCDCFVDWCFYKAYGKTNAMALLGGRFDDYTVNSAQLYKNKGAWYSSPKVGDQIFFRNSSRICHTGLVYAVDSKYVYTVEGNTSSGTAVIANGGAVCKKKYALSNSRIAGYGRPKYDTASTSTTTTTTTTSTGAHIPLNYTVGTKYTVQCTALNIRTKKASQDVSVIPSGTIIGAKTKGESVTCRAAALVNGKIWIYTGVDGKSRECWMCADNGSTAYLA